MLIEVLCFLVVLYVLVRLCYENYTKPWKGFEQAPLPRYTLLGHLPSLFRMSDSEQSTQFHLWLELSKTDSVILWVGCRPRLLTRNRSIFEAILSNHKHISKSNSYRVMKDWLGDSVFLSNGDSWRKRRKLLTPSFHFDILKDFVKTMEKHSLELVKALNKPAETGKIFNAFNIMKMYTIGIISETAMGIESNVVKTAIGEDQNDTKEEDKKFLDIIMTIERVLKTMFVKCTNPLYWYESLFRLLPIGSQYYSDLKMIKSFAMAIIEKRIKNLEKAERPDNINCDTNSNADDGNTGSFSATSRNLKKDTIFLDKMLVLFRNGYINVEDILHETQTFIFGGYDTVATALTWSLYLLGRNKTQQNKAHDEAARVKALGLPITKSIRELHYIECVIKEVLRIHPSASLIARDLREDFQIGTTLYPQGTGIILCIHEIQRDAKNYKEPMVFKPERFLNVEDGVKIKENHHYTFVPFSAGPRNCIGQKFAMMELKTTLFHLLSEYEVIATQKEEDLIETFSMLHGVENENGLEIKFKKRCIKKQKVT